MNRFRASLLALVLGGVVLAGCGAVRPYAAVVNGHRLTQSSLLDELKAIKANKQFLDAVQQSTQVLGSGKGTFDSTFTAKVLTRAIYYELVRAELDRRKLHVTQADLDTARKTVAQQVNGEDVFKKFTASYRDTLVRRTAEVAVLQQALSGSPSEADARAYYDSHKAEFEQVCASHILVDSKDKADAIEARLSKGEDFAAIAKTESKDNQGPGGGSAAKGGDLGCASPDQYVTEFANAVRTLPVGQVSPPVQTQFGFHVIKVSDRKTPPYDQVADQVQQRLQQAGSDKLTEWLSDALKRVKVRGNPKYCKWSNVEGQQPQCQPPAAPTAGVRGTVPPTVPQGGSPIGQTPEP